MAALPRPLRATERRPGGAARGLIRGLDQVRPEIHRHTRSRPGPPRPVCHVGLHHVGGQRPIADASRRPVSPVNGVTTSPGGLAGYAYGGGFQAYWSRPLIGHGGASRTAVQSHERPRDARHRSDAVDAPGTDARERDTCLQPVAHFDTDFLVACHAATVTSSGSASRRAGVDALGYHSYSASASCLAVDPGRPSPAPQGPTGQAL